MGAGPCTRLGEVGSESCRSFTESWRRLDRGLNRAVAKSAVGRYFKLEARKSSFTKEVRAGTATFLTMAYIISVNAAILADSGGTCTVSDCTGPMHAAAHHKPGPECKFTPDVGYEKCVSKVKNDLVVATILSSMVGCLAMGVFANLPLALAPGMGANTYFAYNLVGFHGSGSMSYRTALSLVLVEGCTFFAISAVGLRAKLARLIPRPIRLAAAAGIGLFLAFVGLQAHQGVGLVGPNRSTLVGLAACSYTDPATGECAGKMRSPTFWLGAAGFLITSFCMKKEIKGGMIYGILFVTLVSWVRGTSVTAFPSTPPGDAGYEYFKKVVDFHTIKSTAMAISFADFNRSQVWMALATLLYVDVLDTTGTMYSLAELGGFTDDERTGGFEGEYSAFLVDGGATILSSALGSSTVTTYVESTAGIREGGRTGIAAVTVGLCFFASLFFTPLLTSVPPWAVGPSLVVVGVMMVGLVREIEWGKAEDAVPAFVTMALMPLTYSIANGIVGGVGVYVALRLYDYVARLVKWWMKVRRVMAEARNQVSAATTTTSTDQISPSTPSV